jgi:hypothetical protein
MIRSSEGPVDQPGRSSGLHPEGRAFKSRPVHQSFSSLYSWNSSKQTTRLLGPGQLLDDNRTYFLP